MAFTGKPGTGPIGQVVNAAVPCFYDGTGTPQVSPLAYNGSATIYIVPASAVSITVSNTTDKICKLQIFTDGTTAASTGTFAIAAGGIVTLPVSGMGGAETADFPARIKILPGASGTAGDISFSFNCMTPTGI